MLTLYPPMQALLDADVAGWSRMQKIQDQSRWQHTNGLTLHVEQNRRRAPRWEMNLHLQGQPLTLHIPRTHQGTLGGGIGPLLQDIAAWTHRIDILPLCRIGRQVAAWLTFQGKTGAHTFTLQEKLRDVLAIKPYDLKRLHEQVTMPPQGTLALRPDIDALWRLEPTPHHVRDLPTRTSAPGKMANRIVRVDLPTTAHARLSLAAEMLPELRATLAS